LKDDPDKYFEKAAAEGILFENIQTTCPVSGEVLEDKSVVVDYEGRRIAFCCEKCAAAFDKDPQKYLKKLGENAAPKKTEMTMDHSGHNH
jgi:YHS domain-containing protein